MLRVSALDDQRSEHQGRPESPEAARPPLALVNATIQCDVRKHGPPCAIASTSLLADHTSDLPEIPQINWRKATAVMCLMKAAGQNEDAGQGILGMKFPVDSGNLQLPGCKNQTTDRCFWVLPPRVILP